MFALWRNSKRPGKEKERKGNLAVLERKTADIREKLSRLSLGSGFRRHSAPAQPSQSSGNDCDEGIHYGSISRERSVDPVVLSQLPVPILELILERLSLKELIRVALVHSSWHDMVMKNEFWRRRLSGQLPPELVFHLDRCRGSWSREARRFFNSNLLANPEFKSQGIANAAGLGKHLETNKAWRAQLGCWSVEKDKNFGEMAGRISQNAGSEARIRVLILNTPTWAIPEAAQEVDLIDSLVDSGFSSLAAAAYLDTCPPLTFSVWCLCETEQPTSWQRGFACVVLDNGEDSGAGWKGLRMGSQISRSNATAFWISWAPDPSLLVGSYSLPKEYIVTPRGRFKRLACEFNDYPKGVRRVQILLKGLDPKLIYTNNGKEIKAKGLKPSTEFIAPSLRFKMPHA